MAYLDTSLLVAYYCPEPLSAVAQEAVTAVDTPTISPLVETEVYSAIGAKVRTDQLDADVARGILALFEAHLADGCYAIVPIAASEHRLARNWLGAFTTGLRTLDALHLAAAFANNLPLFTADRALAAAADHWGVRARLFTP
jgi:predicted nucleic acid-binding protein